MKKQYTYGIIIVLILVVGGAFVFYPSPDVTIPPQETVQNNEISVSLSVEGVYESKTVTAHSDETALSLLERLNEEDSQVTLEVKKYSGLGSLVENIGELHNGTDNKYWQYTVNDVMPQIGADKFTLSNGDQIKWFFNTSTQ